MPRAGAPGSAATWTRMRPGPQRAISAARDHDLTGPRPGALGGGGNARGVRRLGDERPQPGPGPGELPLLQKGDRVLALRERDLRVPGGEREPAAAPGGPGLTARVLRPPGD